MTIESVWQDVRQAARALAAHRGFTVAAAGMLALGIGSPRRCSPSWIR